MAAQPEAVPPVANQQPQQQVSTLQPLTVSQPASQTNKISPVRQHSIDQTARRLSKTVEHTVDLNALPLIENKENINVLPLKSANDMHYIKNKTMQSPVNRKKVFVMKIKWVFFFNIKMLLK